MNEDTFMQIKLARFNAAVARALIKALGMHAENMQRTHLGQSMAYTEDSFLILIDQEGIGHDNAIKATKNHSEEDKKKPKSTTTKHYYSVEIGGTTIPSRLDDFLQAIEELAAQYRDIIVETKSEFWK